MVEILRTAQLPNLVEEARRVLPDPVGSQNHAERFLAQYGITKDVLISRAAREPVAAVPNELDQEKGNPDARDGGDHPEDRWTAAFGRIAGYSFAVAAVTAGPAPAVVPPVDGPRSPIAAGPRLLDGLAMSGAYCSVAGGQPRTPHGGC